MTQFKRPEFVITWGDHQLVLGKKTLIMGIVNVTPDSFSDGGDFYNTDAAVAQGLKLAADGADILDIGGESTRPFADAVETDDEIARVVPVVEKLAAKVKVPISIDTSKADVARAALEAGASIVNDIGALRLDPELSKVAAQHDVPVILMHMLGTPRTMQKAPVYDDVIGEIQAFLADAVDKAVKAGIDRAKIIVDPGIGFGKTITHNLRLFQHIEDFFDLDLPVLIGSSRKAFIRNILKAELGYEVDAKSAEVETGTQATVASAIFNGAHIVRVHNVKNTFITAKLMDAFLAGKFDS
jgi:dihydropteroate synthase